MVGKELNANTVNAKWILCIEEGQSTVKSFTKGNVLIIKNLSTKNEMCVTSLQCTCYAGLDSVL